MQHRQLLTQVNQPQLPGLMSNAPGAANMYKLLQQQQQQGGKLNGEQGLPFGGDLDMASMALAQQLQGLQQQQQRQQAQAQATAGGNNGLNPAALLALMQANPGLAQQLGLGQAAARGNDAHGAGNPVAAAAAAAAASAAHQARMQQAALVAALGRNGAPNGLNNQQGKAGLAGHNGNRMPGQQAGAGLQGNGNAQNAAQFAALQRAAAAQVQQMLQQHQQQNAVNQQAQLMQAAAALAAQQQQQQNAQKQAQQMQAQQMLKAVLERSNQAAVHQHQQQQAMGQGGPINTAALMKQLQLHDALAKQDALARAAAAQQQAQANMTPALAELLLRQQAAQQHQQQQDAAARNAGAGGGMNKGPAGLTQAQLQQLASTPAGQALLRSVTNNMALDRAQQQQQQQQPANQGAGARNMGVMNGNANAGTSAAAAAGTMDALLAAQNMMANNTAANKQLNNLTALASGMGTAPGANAEAPLGGMNGNKEQRRLALACVALQLARSGVSVEQAIQSGIMGGMSVMDVRFIVECYNAECERMKAASGASSLVNGGAMGVTRPNTQSVQSSRTHSPAASIAGSHMSLFGMPAQHHGNGGPPPMPQQQQQQHPRFSSMGAPAEHTHSHAGPHPGGYSDQGSPRSRTSAHSGISGNGNANGNGSAIADSPAVAPGNFNAFNYGFFGAGSNAGNGSIKDGRDGTGGISSGELLAELEPEDGTGRSASVDDLASGVTEEQLLWLQSTANAHRARWEGAAEDGAEGGPGDVPWDNNDEIAARLANLDLGSGFM